MKCFTFLKYQFLLCDNDDICVFWFSNGYAKIKELRKGSLFYRFCFAFIKAIK